MHFHRKLPISIFENLLIYHINQSLKDLEYFEYFLIYLRIFCRIFFHFLLIIIRLSFRSCNFFSFLQYIFEKHHVCSNSSILIKNQKYIEMFYSHIMSSVV